jgi:hypothetical protein
LKDCEELIVQSSEFKTVHEFTSSQVWMSD